VQAGDRSAYEADGCAVAGAACQPHGDPVLYASWRHVDGLLGASARLTTRIRACTPTRVGVDFFLTFIRRLHIFNQMVKYMPESLSRVFFALSDPTRRAILARVAEGEVTVTVLAAPFAMSLVAVSKHIRVLEQAGLLQRRKQGREYRLRFVADPLRDAAEWLDSYRTFWTRQLDRLAQHLEQQQNDNEDVK
jgi:DNA-binding transcriptional ArsR family regulator